jgi:hypothetical protein
MELWCQADGGLGCSNRSRTRTLHPSTLSTSVTCHQPDYTYMIGCTNDLAPRHIPEIPKRNDTQAGPFGRFCDMVGI